MVCPSPQRAHYSFINSPPVCERPSAPFRHGELQHSILSTPLSNPHCSALSTPRLIVQQAIQQAIQQV